MVMIGNFFGPRRVAIFAKVPGPPNPTFVSRLVSFILADAIVNDPQAMSFDITRDRSHRRRINWARSPIEPTVTDARILEPDEIQIQGVLSPTPVGGLTTALSALGSIVRRDRETADKLRRIVSHGPVVIVTPERSYASMGVEVVEERHGRGQKIEVLLRASEVRIVSPLGILGEIDLTTILAGAVQDMALGAQGTPTVPDPGGLG